MSAEVAKHWLESHGYRWPPHFEAATKTVDAHAGDSDTARITTSNPGKARPGPTPTAGSIKNAAEALLAAGRVPAKSITWEQFRTELCRNLKVRPEQRGYSLDTIQAVVRPLLLGDRIVESTESTEN